MQNKAKEFGRYFITQYERYRLKNEQFVVISNNCWGYELYNVLNRKYNTPFIGLFLFPECYIQLLENFESINSEISFLKKSKYLSETPGYPVGVLENGIEIHFLHYRSEKEAREKWNRRVSRLQTALRSNVPAFVKFCDRDGCTTAHLNRFHALPFNNKMSIGIKPFDAECHLHCDALKDSHQTCVIDGVKLFNKRYKYFDIANWISKGQIKKSMVSRCLALFQ